IRHNSLVRGVPYTPASKRGFLPELRIRCSARASRCWTATRSLASHEGSGGPRTAPRMQRSYLLIAGLADAHGNLLFDPAKGVLQDQRVDGVAVRVEVDKAAVRVFERLTL